MTPDTSAYSLQCFKIWHVHSSLHIIQPAMNPIRPPLLDAALKTCTRSHRTPACRNALRIRAAPSARRCISDGSRPPTPPGRYEKNTVWMPKTRIAVGIVFCGTLIYSMVRKRVGGRVHWDVLANARRNRSMATRKCRILLTNSHRGQDSSSMHLRSRSGIT